MGAVVCPINHPFLLPELTQSGPERREEQQTRGRVTRVALQGEGLLRLAAEKGLASSPQLSALSRNSPQVKGELHPKSHPPPWG